MEAERLSYHPVQQGKYFHFFVCHRTKRSIWVGKVFHLFLIQGIPGDFNTTTDVKAKVLTRLPAYEPNA
jgi:hypothetical protein